MEPKYAKKLGDLSQGAPEAVQPGFGSCSATAEDPPVGTGERLDVVPLSTPQLSITEVMQVAELLQGRTVHPNTTLLVYTPIEIKQACERLGVQAIIEATGGHLVHGHDFFATYAREIREAHGWERMMTHSVKMTNICEGYGYKPTPASIARCVESAIAGRVLG